MRITLLTRLVGSSRVACEAVAAASIPPTPRHVTAKKTAANVIQPAVGATVPAPNITPTTTPTITPTTAAARIRIPANERRLFRRIPAGASVDIAAQ